MPTFREVAYATASIMVPGVQTRMPLLAETFFDFRFGRQLPVLAGLGLVGYTFNARRTPLYSQTPDIIDTFGPDGSNRFRRTSLFLPYSFAFRGIAQGVETIIQALGDTETFQITIPGALSTGDDLVMTIATERPFESEDANGRFWQITSYSDNHATDTGTVDALPIENAGKECDIQVQRDGSFEQFLPMGEAVSVRGEIPIWIDVEPTVSSFESLVIEPGGVIEEESSRSLRVETNINPLLEDFGTRIRYGTTLDGTDILWRINSIERGPSSMFLHLSARIVE